jgi:malonyl-CoA/methylmalonyl-CoA synthetase
MALDKIEGVRESAVIGLADEDFGEAVTAIVVPMGAEGSLDPEYIRRTLQQNLANFKVPKHVFFVSELPRNTMGKVQKNTLREEFGKPWHLCGKC